MEVIVETTINDIICTGTKLLEAAFLLAYLDPKLWSDKYIINIETVNPVVVPDTNGIPPTITTMVEKIHIFDAKFQK